MLDKNDLRMIGELLDEKLVPIKEDICELKENVNRLETRMDGLEARMDGLEAKVDGLKKEIADLRVEEHYKICEEVRENFNNRINNNTERLARYRDYWCEITKITQSMAAA